MLASYCFLNSSTAELMSLRQGVHVGHGEGPQSADAHKLAALLAPEAVPGDLEHLQGHGLVGDGHVVAHEELAEAGGETQEQPLLVRLDLVLPGGEPIEVLLEGRVVHVVHDGRLYFHGAHVRCPVQDVVLQQGFDQPALWVEPHVSRIGARLVVHQLKPPHQLHVGRDLVHDPALGYLVVDELAQVLVACEVELVSVHKGPVGVHDLPVGDGLGLGLEGLGDHLALAELDGPGQLRQRMAFAAQSEGLVPAEGCAHDLVILGQRLLHALEDLDRGGRRGKVGAEVSIRVKHDAVGVDLACHVHDLLCTFGYHGLGVVFVELLHGHEGAQGFFEPAFFGSLFYLFGELGGPLGLELDVIRVD